MIVARPSPAEDRFNTLSHLVGAVLSLLGTAVLVGLADDEHKPWHVAGFAIYGCSMVAVFLASTLHHGLRLSPHLQELFRQADYIGIFLLIAGTFTAISVVVDRNAFGLTVLGVVWGIALVGIGLVIGFPHLPSWITTPMYLGMGWLGTLLVGSLEAMTGPGGIILLLSGGLFYTVGAIMLAFKYPNPWPGKFEHHEVWHVLVLLGAFSHYLLMYAVLPLP